MICEKIQLIGKYRGDLDHAQIDNILFTIILGRRDSEVISDGEKLKLKLFEMTKHNFKDFLKKYNVKNDTVNESEIQIVYNFPMYRRASMKTADEIFVNVDNGKMDGTHCVCYYIKDNKSFYFHSVGGQPDKNLL